VRFPWLKCGHFPNLQIAHFFFTFEKAGQSDFVRFLDSVINPRFINFLFRTRGRYLFRSELIKIKLEKEVDEKRDRQGKWKAI